MCLNLIDNPIDYIYKIVLKSCLSFVIFEMKINKTSLMKSLLSFTKMKKRKG